jgi:hypothetical protein
MSGSAPPRVDPDAVRTTLRAAGLRARHSLSQNFLADPDVLDAILAEADPAPGRRILEIGPGLGLLTGALVAAPTTSLPESIGGSRRSCASASRTSRTCSSSRRRARPGSSTWSSPATWCQPAVPHHEPDPPRAAGAFGPGGRVQREVAERIAAAPGR